MNADRLRPRRVIDEQAVGVHDVRHSPKMQQRDESQERRLRIC